MSEHFVCWSHNELRNFSLRRKIRNGPRLEFGCLERTLMMSLTWAINSVDVQRKGQLGHLFGELLSIDSNLMFALVSKL